ncbi:hypothetical protein SP90_08410 [Halodesulfovibrio spirochaetisodalis]|uniref:Uncharacterized protein n=2 Tax=Halodesulfovibrio spirochaetisodalis TaxID=1560234 RepID=A0A1B7XD40_9BACT|nr:hypothetical protein SP90_08410 [Halodesulfovibrio spirochaetisodalis]
MPMSNSTSESVLSYAVEQKFDSRGSRELLNEASIDDMLAHNDAFFSNVSDRVFKAIKGNMEDIISASLSGVVSTPKAMSHLDVKGGVGGSDAYL